MLLGGGGEEASPCLGQANNLGGPASPLPGTIADVTTPIAVTVPHPLRERVGRALSGTAPGSGTLGPHTAAARDALAAAGFAGVAVPREWGGLGEGVAGACTVADEAAAHGFPFALPRLSAVTVGSALVHHGTPEQREGWLRGLAGGRTGIALAVSEPETGARLGAIRTEARPRDGGWELSGRKRNITGASDAGALLVVAATGGPGVLSLFLVPTDRPGVTVSPMEGAATPLGSQDDIELDAVALGPGDLVGRAGAGIDEVFSALNPERLVIAATTTGLARRLVSLAVQEAPAPARLPLMAAYGEVEAARLAVDAAARAFDATGSAGPAVTVAKLASAAASRRAVEATTGGLDESVLSPLDRTLGMLERFPVGRDQLAAYLLQTLVPAEA